MKSDKKPAPKAELDPKAYIEYCLEGIEKEMQEKNINIGCQAHKVFCVGCALGEIKRSLEYLEKKSS